MAKKIDIARYNTKNGWAEYALMLSDEEKKFARRCNGELWRAKARTEKVARWRAPNGKTGTLDREIKGKVVLPFWAGGMFEVKSGAVNNRGRAYGICVEYGTRYMEKQPYLNPAINLTVPELEKKFADLGADVLLGRPPRGGSAFGVG